MTALVITVAQGAVRPAVAVFPAAVITAAGVLLLTWPGGPWRPPGGLWQRGSVLPGWSIGRLWRLSLISCGVVAACDAASGPHLILIGLLVIGPVCALLTARWALTAAASCLAIALGVALGVPDQIFATVTQYVFLAAVTAVGTAATAGAAVLAAPAALIGARVWRTIVGLPSRELSPDSASVGRGVVYGLVSCPAPRLSREAWPALAGGSSREAEAGYDSCRIVGLRRPTARREATGTGCAGAGVAAGFVWPRPQAVGVAGMATAGRARGPGGVLTAAAPL